MWVLGLPDTSLRTPATRCFEELVALWRHRFRSRHPNGLKVNAPKTRLKLEYRAASGGFSGQIDVSDAAGPLPDIAAISAPVAGLRDLLTACTEELAPYSRLLGKNPAARGTIDAALLLPPELDDATTRTEARERIEEMFAGRSVTAVTVAQLAGALSLDVAGMEKLPAGLSNQIGAYLDRMDIGFEPDRRYGSSPLRLEGHLVMFKAPGGGRIDGDAAAFAAARAMVDVAALAAGSDDRIDQREIDAINSEIRGAPGLGTIERARLMAYANTLLKDTSLHRYATLRLKSLDAAAKQSVVRSATAAILADGHASPSEVRFLERLHRTLGLPEDGVYSMLHRSAVVMDEPVAVMPERRSFGVAIPHPVLEDTASGTIRIDHSRLARLKSETATVSELLAGIFVEEDTVAAPTPVPIAVPAAAASRFPGLDATHMALLEEVLAAGDMDRGGFDEKARCDFCPTVRSR